MISKVIPLRSHSLLEKNIVFPRVTDEISIVLCKKVALVVNYILLA